MMPKLKINSSCTPIVASASTKVLMEIAKVVVTLIPVSAPNKTVRNTSRSIEHKEENFLEVIDDLVKTNSFRLKKKEKVKNYLQLSFTFSLPKIDCTLFNDEIRDSKVISVCFFSQIIWFFFRNSPKKR